MDIPEGSPSYATLTCEPRLDELVSILHYLLHTTPSPVYLLRVGARATQIESNYSRIEHPQPKATLYVRITGFRPGTNPHLLGSVISQRTIDKGTRPAFPHIITPYSSIQLSTNPYSSLRRGSDSRNGGIHVDAAAVLAVRSAQHRYTACRALIKPSPEKEA